MSEIDDPRSAEQLRAQLKLQERFDAASPAEEFKDEIDLGEPYREVTQFRMDPASFLVKHVPSITVGAWSAMTGPKSLKNSVEGWVDGLNAESKEQ